MRKVFFYILALSFCLSAAFAQTSRTTKGDTTEILKAEDARRYDKTLEDLMNSADERVKVRAMLAAGRIGDEKAIPRLASMLESGSINVREMAAFALGEIESTNAADAIEKALKDPKTLAAVRARAVEAAGKIAAANAKDANAKELGEAILDTLEAEDSKGNKQDRDVVLLALTAALRARPEDADLVVMKFLTNLDSHIRADAANTLARLRTKSANTALRAIVMSDDDPVARANAVRALGAAEDKESLNILIDAATEDDDSRVRVSAIRSLAALKDPYAVDKLLDRAELLLATYKKMKKPNLAPAETNELFELAVVLGRLVPKTNDARTVKFLKVLAEADGYRSPEISIALLRVSPTAFNFRDDINIMTDWQLHSSFAQILGEVSAIEPSTEEVKRLKGWASAIVRKVVKNMNSPSSHELWIARAFPDFLRAFAKYQTDDLSEILRASLGNSDVFVRATAAELLGEQTPSRENIQALKIAFTESLQGDRHYNDAQLGILDALYKLDKKEAVGSLLTALNAPDYLVRKKAFELLTDKDLQKDFPGIATSLANARMNRKDQVLPYSPAFGTKLGQVLNTDADYRRAAALKNGMVKAVFTTQKGTFTIDLLPEDAPLTVDNFVKLAQARYFNGLAVHRVVPNFVMQDGDPRGDGNGGPGWSIRCEVNMLPYDRGAVGMALSGKDTGGSQWFVTHSPQPHLDGGYTVFGKVNEKDMKVVDNIVRGDKIISVKIVEGISTQRSLRTRRQK
jgi:cyclophilin family peptidyl-prolyl cis-trans isomerase/HEAT repeat protein